MKPLYAEPPRAIIPKTMEAILDSHVIAAVPTHFLAVYSSAPPTAGDPTTRLSQNLKYRRAVLIYPVHAIVFAAHCSRLPSIPESIPELASIACREMLTLPVIPLRVPRINQFPVVMQYLYSYDWRQLVVNLIPLHPIPDLRETDLLADDPQSPFMHIRTMRHATQLFHAVPLERFPIIKDRIWGVYQNIVALGISDRRMWQVVCFCYDVASLAEDLHQQKTLMARMSPPRPVSKGFSHMRDGKLGFLPSPPRHNVAKVLAK